MKKKSKQLIKICVTYTVTFILTFILTLVGVIAGFIYSFVTQKPIVFPLNALKIMAGNLNDGSSGIELYYSNNLWYFLILFPILLSIIVFIIEYMIKRKKSNEK